MLSSHKEQVRFPCVVFGCSAHFEGRRQVAAEMVARQDFAVEDELDGQGLLQSHHVARSAGRGHTLSHDATNAYSLIIGNIYVYSARQFDIK
jgi:hypothetical protein